MIYLITGKPRHGKGLYTFGKVDEKAKRENRQVYYVHIPECKFDWIELKDISEWPKLPHGAIIVVDEAHNYFPQEKIGARRPEYIQLLDQHAQFGYDFYIISQNPKGITTYLRDRVEEHWHLIRKFGKEVSTVYKFYDVQPVPLSKSSKENAIKETFHFPKHLYGMYRSAQMHNVKVNVPFRYYLLYIIPVIVIVLIWYGLTGLASISEKWETHEPETSLSNDPSLFGLGVGTKKGGLVQSPGMDYYAARAERLHGLPHTAPIYDEITKPVEAPLPAACVLIRNECTCYTQQATKLNTPDDTCRQIVEKGYFVDFQNGKAIESNQTDYETQEAKQVPEPVLTSSGALFPVEVAKGELSEPDIPKVSKITRERMQSSPWAYKHPS